MRPAFKPFIKLYIGALVPSLCCAAESLEIQTLKRVYSRAPGYMVAIANNPPKHLPENHPWNLQIVAVSTVTNLTAQASNVQFGNESTVEPASDEYSTERHANCTSVDRSYKLTTTQTVESVSTVGYTDLVATTRDSK